MRFSGLLIPAIMVSLLIPALVQAETWPQFRGATGSGISTEKNLPAKWSEQEGLLWSVALPGRANSSPAVTANRIDLTSKTDDNGLWIISLDRKSGQEIRKVKVGSGSLSAPGPRNLWAHRHNPATPSPIADEQNIWAFFGSGLLVCLDAESGEIVWKRDLVKDYGPYNITFGMGSTPRLWGNLLFVTCMTKGPSYVVAFDKQTGKEVWKANRKLPAQKDGADAYSTPTIFQNGDKTELLVSGSDHVNAYNPQTGKQLWIAGGLDIPSPFGRIIAAPVANSNLVIATTGNPGGGGLGYIKAFKQGASGNITKSGLLWKYDVSTADSSTPLILDDKLYMVSQNGIATCLNLKDGEPLWKKRMKGEYFSALVAGDGKVYFLSTDGLCTVIDADSGDVIAENQLPGTFYSTPAISEGVIYLRSFDRLYAIKEK
ncbi:PQQ-binding-like beta-propeller repeat protein [uncultured Gimesia sp.]|uniref:outer membrane protein assembly factor BamB family protein n=1 Tax=uncultured Gimesia sp. TaxID=1678688 RepID=UPI0030DCC8EF|tara:strand:+ start:40484 stop:41773 length:1290 start_codon:yes stop_codon:yes gene_type:complete